ncbi:MAG: c-type cytochrome [Proteobacteria bacterium]|nr:c-type cytochrome [Pseudomonadota bacterium]
MIWSGSAVVAANLFVAVAFLSLVSGCDNTQPKVQYVPDMADAPTLKPQENYLEPPLHSVALNAVLYPKTREDSEANLKNPLPQDERVLKLGEKMFNTYCTPCHGTGGKGDGSITDVYIKPPDLTDAVYLKRGDGFFFHTITFGANVMPGYGHATQAHERWAIVHYLRKLQGQLSQPVPAPAQPQGPHGGVK